MSLIQEMKGVVMNLLGVINACLSVTTLEAKLAAYSVLPLLATVFFLFICILSSWLTIMAVVAYGLMQILHSVWLVLAGMIGLHGIALIILACCLRYNLKQMSFEKTRTYLAQLRLAKGVSCERSENNNQTNSSTRKLATTPST